MVEILENNEYNILMISKIVKLYSEIVKTKSEDAKNLIRCTMYSVHPT